MPERRIAFFSCFFFGATLLCLGLNSPLRAQGRTVDTTLYKVAQPKDDRAEGDGADTDTTSVGDSTSSVVRVTPPDSAVSTDTAAAEPPWYNFRKDGPPLILQPKTLPKGTVDSLLKDDDFWYVSVGAGKPEPVKGIKPIRIPFWVSFLVWTLLAGGLVAGIVFFLQTASGESLFRRSRKRRLLQTETPADLDGTVDLNLALQQAIDQANFGEAVRLLYLRTLTNLGAQGLIIPGPDKTNREYLRELTAHPLYRDFARLLRQYEYIYYGGFSMEEPTFRTIQAQYVQFQNRLDTL